MKIILAVTAASGAIYASQILELLSVDPKVKEVALIFSRSAREVAEYELIKMPNSDKITEYDVDDLFSPPASGSAKWSAMIVAPCSVGTMSRITAGISDSLISRAADVMLKERRRLILVVRETPLSLIHLRNMTALTEAGAIIMPASVSFYGGASNINELALTVSRRAVAMAGCTDEVEEWQGR